MNLCLRAFLALKIDNSKFLITSLSLCTCISFFSFNQFCTILKYSISTCIVYSLSRIRSSLKEIINFHWMIRAYYYYLRFCYFFHMRLKLTKTSSLMHFKLLKRNIARRSHTIKSISELTPFVTVRFLWDLTTLHKHLGIVFLWQWAPIPFRLLHKKYKKLVGILKISIPMKRKTCNLIKL